YVKIISAAFEERVRFHFHGQIKVARWGTHCAGIAFAGNTHASAVGHTCGDADIDCFVVANASFAAARFTRSAEFARAATPRAGNIEAHLAGLLLNRSGAIASRTSLRAADGSSAVARLAGVKAGDLNFLYRPANCFPKIDFDAVFEVCAFFRLFL